MRTFKIFISFRLSNELLNTEVIISNNCHCSCCTRQHETTQDRCRGQLRRLLVLVLAAGVPGQPLLVELDHHLGTLHVGLPRRHQVRLVTPLPLDQEHQLSAAVRRSDDPLRLEAAVESPWSHVLGRVKLLAWRFPSLLPASAALLLPLLFLQFKLIFKSFYKLWTIKILFGLPRILLGTKSLPREVIFDFPIS